jgi:hypothetical protein
MSLTQDQFVEKLDTKIREVRGYMPDTPNEASSIDMDVRTLEALKTKKLAWLKQHANEKSGLKSYWNKNLSWAEAANRLLGINLKTVRIPELDIARDIANAEVAGMVGFRDDGKSPMEDKVPYHVGLHIAKMLGVKKGETAKQTLAGIHRSLTGKGKQRRTRRARRTRRT